MNANGYPEPEELEIIRQWDAIHDPLGLIEYIRERWAYADAGYFKFDAEQGTLELHTAGWSGNESIVDALMDNPFWMFFWEKSERGGYYYFDDAMMAGDLKWKTKLAQQ